MWRHSPKEDPTEGEGESGAEQRAADAASGVASESDAVLVQCSPDDYKRYFGKKHAGVFAAGSPNCAPLPPPCEPSASEGFPILLHAFSLFIEFSIKSNNLG